MGRLIYSAITSLDGYVADRDGHFDWSTPDEEVHRYINDRERPVGTYLYGHGMYEVMKAWEDISDGENPPYIDEYAGIWQAADKIVFSTTLVSVETERTRLERVFDPALVLQLKDQTDRDLSIGGADLAGQAIRAGLVDEYGVAMSPVIVGGGKPWLPDDIDVDLELVDNRTFDNGVVFLRYRVRH
jgi:dihydrofolate reductase